MHRKRSISGSANHFLAKALLLSFVALPEAAHSEEGGIYIEFMARPTAPITGHTPGHIFVCISLDLAPGIKEECFGFYPQDPLKAFDGAGTVSNEFKKPAIQNVSISLRHKINQTT